MNFILFDSFRLLKILDQVFLTMNQFEINAINMFEKKRRKKLFTCFLLLYFDRRLVRKGKNAKLSLAIDWKNADPFLDAMALVFVNQTKFSVHVTKSFE